MIEKVLFLIEFWKNGRHPKFRINQQQKNRIFQFYQVYFKNCDSIYIGGSQSKFNIKNPKKDSDIDLYIFSKYYEGISLNEQISKDFKLSLGLNIQVFLVNLRFKDPIVQGMEQLIYE